MINEPTVNGNLIAHKNYAIDTNSAFITAIGYPIAAPIAAKTFTEASTNVACRSVMLIP